MDNTPYFEVVRYALATVYGGGSAGDMVYSLAQHIILELPRWIAESWAEDAQDAVPYVEHQMHLTIWNWFPGGSTAEVAAHRVMASLEAVVT